MSLWFLSKTLWELKSPKKEMQAWLSRNPRRSGSMARGQGPVADVDRTGQLFDVTIYIYAGIVLGK
jgi:hypothetical protein